MTDRELLEAAARAAGLDDAKFQDMEGWGEVRYGYSSAIWSEKLFEEDGSGYWNPLVDDASALRLAIDLRLNMGSLQEGIAWDDPDRYAKMRRAIVRAAASLGESKDV